MNDRAGVSPEGGAPDRRSRAEPPAPRAPSESAGASAAPPRSEAGVADATVPAIDDRPTLEPSSEGESSSDDPLAPYRPAEPTLRADPAVREFDVPIDTGQLRRISTGQLLVVHRPEYDQREVVEAQQQSRAYSWVAAVTGTVGATASLFVGWMLPLSIAAIVFGVLGLRREEHGRTLAFVGIGTGLGGLVFSALWIGYYAIVFGALPS
ncbi:DUF4190 domain-containing protein [Agromyces italicus]|uniref:DUF4190 domain-containing protein n=1 Tax=Agromyces italicus TaxID=279572 RepID=UPI0003B5A104|nr:DUF4190 domain-containing protein [Agromyces italicus]